MAQPLDMREVLWAVRRQAMPDVGDRVGVLVESQKIRRGTVLSARDARKIEVEFNGDGAAPTEVLWVPLWRIRAVPQSAPSSESSSPSSSSRMSCSSDSEDGAADSDEEPDALRHALGVLGLDPDKRDYSKSQLRQNWKARTLAAHPDKGGSSSAFRELQEAYETCKRALL